METAYSNNPKGKYTVQGKGLFGLLPTLALPKNWVPIKSWSLSGFLPKFWLPMGVHHSSHRFLPNSWPNEGEEFLGQKIGKPTFGKASVGINQTHP